jgi:hypothetical protein
MPHQLNASDRGRISEGFMIRLDRSKPVKSNPEKLFKSSGD